MENYKLLLNIESIPKTNIFKFKKVYSANKKIFIASLEINYYSEILCLGILTYVNSSTNDYFSKIFSGVLSEESIDVLKYSQQQVKMIINTEKNYVENTNIKKKIKEIMLKKLTKLLDNKTKNMTFVGCLEKLVKQIT